MAICRTRKDDGQETCIFPQLQEVKESAALDRTIVGLRSYEVEASIHQVAYWSVGQATNETSPVPAAHGQQSSLGRQLIPHHPSATREQKLRALGFSLF